MPAHSHSEKCCVSRERWGECVCVCLHVSVHMLCQHSVSTCRILLHALGYSIPLALTVRVEESLKAAHTHTLSQTCTGRKEIRLPGSQGGRENNFRIWKKDDAFLWTRSDREREKVVGLSFSRQRRVCVFATESQLILFKQFFMLPFHCCIKVNQFCTVSVSIGIVSVSLIKPEKRENSRDLFKPVNVNT